MVAPLGGCQRPTVGFDVDAVCQPADDHESGRGEIPTQRERETPPAAGRAPAAHDRNGVALDRTPRIAAYV